MSDDYVELVRTAKEALGDLLTNSEPGTGWLLHRAYNLLKTMAAPAATQPPLPEREAEGVQRRRREEEWRQRRARWHKTPRAVRDRLALEALGDERLSAREVAQRLQAAEHLHEGASVQSVLVRLLDAKEVRREEAPGYRAGPYTRWLYFRESKLTGPIVELEAVFHEANEGEVS